MVRQTARHGMILNGRRSRPLAGRRAHERAKPSRVALAAIADAWKDLAAWRPAKIGLQASPREEQMGVGPRPAAVDVGRALAMDAVQAAANGHPAQP